jgi:hypothetical protein
MGTWDRQPDWKEIDEEVGRGGNRTNRVMPQLKNLKVAPSIKQGLFGRIKSYIKDLLKL